MNNQKIITFVMPLINTEAMDKKEIKKIIKEEKNQMILFLKAAVEAGIPQKEIEKQINFYLDKINELKEKIKNNL